VEERSPTPSNSLRMLDGSRVPGRSVRACLAETPMWSDGRREVRLRSLRELRRDSLRV
jgi:hypothetical protein